MKGRRNPAVARANKLRAAVASELTEAKIRMVVNALFKKAMAGNPHAIEIFLKYAIGPAVNFDLIERIRAVENAAGLDVSDEFDEPLKSPLLDFEFDRDGRPMPVRGKPRKIRRIVNDEDADHD
ncbi:MAG: hypothetical protein NXI14_05965 [bacterium]|nr:hypothetical protein [bacterium]